MSINDYLSKLKNQNINLYSILNQIIEWIKDNYNDMVVELKWNQPMFVWNGTYVIGFSYAKSHVSVAIEKVFIDNFIDDFKENNYAYSKMLFKINENNKINFDLFKKMIDYVRQQKNDCKSFWFPTDYKC